jgi:tripartite-type tricarboxylate transporter receptor subunit TctC
MAYLERKVRVRLPCDIAFKPNKTRNKAEALGEDEMVRLCALALVLMTADGACAQSWPSRPIRAIVPYTLEAGFANSDYNFWVGMFVPAKTSRDVVERLHRETVKVLQSPDIQAKLSSFGADPMLMQPTEFDTYVRNGIAANETLVGLAAK